MAFADFMGNRDFYKFFYAGEQDAQARAFQRETGWHMIWGSDEQGLNGDTWMVYREVSDLPRYLQDYARMMEPESTRYYHPELDLDGTADELFVQARNGYIEEPEALQEIAEILYNENKYYKCLYVGVLKEIAEDTGEKPYVVAQMKKDMLDGVSPEEVTVRDGLVLEVRREQDEVLVSLRDEETGARGASSVPYEDFLKMNASQFEECVNAVFYYNMHNDEREVPVDEEPLVDIFDLEYDDEGYLHFQVEADGYSLVGLFRLHDPANGPDLSLVSIDFGDRHPIIERQWDRIEAALVDASAERYKAMIAQPSLDAVIQSCENMTKSWGKHDFERNLEER